MKETPDGIHVTLTEGRPVEDRFLEDVREGLRRSPKAIPCKYFYDAEGSRLFDVITTLPEYYPTRTERAIMEASIDEIVAALGPRCLLVEYGSGSSLKTRILLDHLEAPAGYLPIDISREHLLRSGSDLMEAYPDLPIHPIHADYTRQLVLPEIEESTKNVCVYFPGSTIGNFTPPEAEAFLRRIAGVAGPGGGLLVGVDLRKDPAVLRAAYNDARGVTAAFNKNLLVRIDRELGADFDPERFAHDAVYDAAHGRIEMYLVSKEEQVVHLEGEAFRFAEGERLLTEYSYKYDVDAFARLAAGAGFTLAHVWTDPDRYFSVLYLRTASGDASA